MISYDPFWKTLKEQKITKYRLIKMGISQSTLYRIRDNKNINTATINDLCTLLNVDVDKIIKFIPDNKKDTP